MNYPNMKEGKSMYFNIEFPNKMAHAYSVMCKPLCQEMKLPQTAFDILMFLSNNPQYKTARDIVEVRKIKANLVSINVDKLVKEGYLERREVTGDRRKTELVCTSQADFIIEKGRLVQKTFKDTLFNNMDDSMKEILFKNGYVEDYNNPSLIIINTCAVTSIAEHKSRQKTSSYAKKFPNAIIVVCGCSTNIHPEDYQKMNFAHIIMSNNNHEDILKLIDEYNKTQKQVFAVDNTDNIDVPFYSMGMVFIDGKTYEKIICLNKIDALPLAPTVEDGYICFIENLS